MDRGDRPRGVLATSEAALRRPPVAVAANQSCRQTGPLGSMHVPELAPLLDWQHWSAMRQHDSS
jgi:hypothetical protein